MADSLKDRLRDVTKILVDPARPAYSLRDEVMELRAIFETAGDGPFDRSVDIAAGETLTAGGVAISPTMAAMCVDDFARTVQFIRGTHNAILDLHGEPGTPVNVLYAGCGPWAPLAVPLMSIFEPARVQFTLLDIHPESIRSVKRITEALELRDRVRKLEINDAANYSIGAMPPDLIVIEMLRPALDAEPQVAAARNLSRQAPGAVMVPREVRIDLMLVDPSLEHSTAEDAPKQDRIFVATIFQLDHETIGSIGESTLRVKLPSFDESRYRPMLLTSVTVYGEIRLSDYDSGITLPMRVPAAIVPGATVEFVYEMSERPRLNARVI